MTERQERDFNNLVKRVRTAAGDPSAANAGNLEDIANRLEGWLTDVFPAGSGAPAE